MKSLPSITHITKQHLIFISWIFTLDAGLAVCALPIITFDMRNHVKCEVQTAWMTYTTKQERDNYYALFKATVWKKFYVLLG